MSKNQNSVQLLTIPAPRFKHGDLVEWSCDFGEKIYIYRGLVMHRLWCEDEPKVLGHWEYCLQILTVIIDGVSRKYESDDTALEPQLKPIESLFGTDTGIDTGIDTEYTKISKMLTVA